MIYIMQSAKSHVYLAGMKMQQFNDTLAGLSQQQVAASRAVNGENKIEKPTEYPWLNAIRNAVKEPMLLLLATASTLYFFHGDLAEAIFLLAAIALVYSISSFQESRSKKALDALKSLTQPKCKVIRDNKIQEIKSEELVVNDLMVVEEGSLIPADGTVIQSNDFTVNESILTGESLSVDKNGEPGNNLVYQGTLVLTGLAFCSVTQIGIHTKVGQIEKSISEVKDGKSPLQLQITNFVRKMAAIGVVAFLIIWAVNIYQTRLIVESLLNSLTLAMSILPEEIPVAFATFMALGAWRLIQLGVIVKETKTVETLGGATVICIDKTGTITKNEMTLNTIYVYDQDNVFDTSASNDIRDVVTIAMWASEPIPFDPMEKSIHEAYSKVSSIDLRNNYKLIKEYPLSGKPPLMTHVFADEAGNKIIAAKGAPEAILAQSTLSQPEKNKVSISLESLASKGYRVLGVGLAEPVREFPENQMGFKFAFKGLVAFYDPPKENIANVLKSFYNAGINVKIITGDNSKTAVTIAKQIDFKGSDKMITGDLLMEQSDNELAATVSNTAIFARMFPEAKLRVIQALKNQGEIVAMTGDGVNDGPALKAAHIGIAMGHKGSEMAKQASALILADDNLERMVDAIAAGRKIYNNLKKAIQYIISIHIPIILIVFIPLVLGWLYPAIFSPVHVIFLELIMGPTCSIIYENEPIEKDAMRKKPRIFSKTFFNTSELSTSVLQGLVITVALLGIYWYAISSGQSLPTTTSMVFITLITANILLTLVNRSFTYSLLTTLKYKNNLIPVAIGITISFVVVIFVIAPLREFFRFEIPTPLRISVSIAAGILSVIWFEAYKKVRRFIKGD